MGEHSIKCTELSLEGRQNCVTCNNSWLLVLLLLQYGKNQRNAQFKLSTHAAPKTTGQGGIGLVEFSGPVTYLVIVKKKKLLLICRTFICFVQAFLYYIRALAISTYMSQQLNLSQQFHLTVLAIPLKCPSNST